MLLLMSTSAPPGANVVDWHHKGDRVSLSLRWLRMECPCSLCRVEQTSERRWIPARADEFVATSIDQNEGSIKIAWESGHLTQYSPEQIRASLGIENRARLDTQLWGGGGEPARFGHDAVCAGGSDRMAFLAALRNEGVAILTGTPSIPAQVEITMAALGLPLRETFSERVHDVLVDPAGYNIAHTAEGLPPHSDYPSYSHPPSGQVLHMLVNECEGGDSLVVDGWQAASALRETSPRYFELLASVPVGFRQYSSDRESFARQPLIRLDTFGVINGFRYSNQLMQPIGPDDPVFEEWLDAYLALTEYLTNPANQRRFRLGGGDAMFVHGHRVLHGRSEFVPNGARHLQDCYFDFDDVLAVADRLSGLAQAKPVAAAS